MWIHESGFLKYSVVLLHTGSPVVDYAWLHFFHYVNVNNLLLSRNDLPCSSILHLSLIALGWLTFHKLCHLCTNKSSGSSDQDSNHPFFGVRIDFLNEVIWLRTHSDPAGISFSIKWSTTGNGAKFARQLLLQFWKYFRNVLGMFFISLIDL